MNTKKAVKIIKIQKCEKVPKFIFKDFENIYISKVSSSTKTALYDVFMALFIYYVEGHTA